MSIRWIYDVGRPFICSFQIPNLSNEWGTLTDCWILLYKDQLRRTVVQEISKSGEYFQRVQKNVLNVRKRSRIFWQVVEITWTINCSCSFLCRFRRKPAPLPILYSLRSPFGNFSVHSLGKNYHLKYKKFKMITPKLRICSLLELR